MNRDERRNRPETGELSSHQLNGGKLQLLYPVDNESGGTWFGLNNHGVVMAILNRYQDASYTDKTTRGGIIPAALAQGSIDDVLTYCKALEATQFNPFDLLVFSASQSNRFCWTGTEYQVESLSTAVPCFFSSSAVTTKQTIAKRQAFFHQWYAQQDIEKLTPRMILQSVHRQQDDSDHSILMSREFTHTKSISQVVLTAGDGQFYYYANPALSSSCQIHFMLMVEQ